MRKIVSVIPILALVASACSGGGSGDGATVKGDPVSLLRGASARAKDAGTARFAMTIALGFEIGGEGALDLRNERGAFSFDLGAMFERLGAGTPPDGVATSLDMTYSGNSVYMRAPEGHDLGAGIDWIKIDQDKLASAGGSGNFLSGSSDPSGFFDALGGIVGDPIAIGPETIRGVATTGYQVNLDLAEAVKQAPEAQREALRGTFAEFENEVPARVWIDADGLVRKQEMTFTAAGQPMKLTLELFDYGKPVDVTIPSDDSVLEVSSEADLTEIMSAIFGA